jgi:predicted nucleic acid-binding protein
VDTSVFIAYFRTKDKATALLTDLAGQYDLAISVITQYEILNGSNEHQELRWEALFRTVKKLPFAEAEAREASNIYIELKSKGTLVSVADILIAATARANALKFATLNQKHFDRIPGLILV